MSVRLIASAASVVNICNTLVSFFYHRTPRSSLDQHTQRSSGKCQQGTSLVFSHILFFSSYTFFSGRAMTINPFGSTQAVAVSFGEPSFLLCDYMSLCGVDLT